MRIWVVFTRRGLRRVTTRPQKPSRGTYTQYFELDTPHEWDGNLWLVPHETRRAVLAVWAREQQALGLLQRAQAAGLCSVHQAPIKVRLEAEIENHAASDDESDDEPEGEPEGDYPATDLNGTAARAPVVYSIHCAHGIVSVSPYKGWQPAEGEVPDLPSVELAHWMLWSKNIDLAFDHVWLILADEGYVLDVCASQALAQEYMARAVAAQMCGPGRQPVRVKLNTLRL